MPQLGPDVSRAIELLKSMGVTGDPQDPSVRTRTRVLQAAIELFRARGYRHTSVDEIAREAGVAKGTVYVHFKDKQELLLHAIAEEKKQFLQAFVPLLEAELSPTDRLLRYLEQSFLALQRAPLICKLMLGDRQILLQLSEHGAGMRERVHELQLRSLMALLCGVGAFDALSAREQKQRARVLLSLLLSATQTLAQGLDYGLRPEVYARQLAKIIVAGVGAS
jgi:AcrR family transcriptional regulator